MPVYHLNVKVKEMGPETEKKLSEFGKVIKGIAPLNLYFFDVEVPIGTPLEVAEAYGKLLSEIKNEPYVTDLKESVELESLSNNKIALDVGIQMELNRLKSF